MITFLSAVVVAVITYIFGPIVVNKIKNKKVEENNNTIPKTPLGNAVIYGLKIDKIIKKTLEKLNCDRIWIAQFHNGGHFYPSHKSIQKFSIFYEYAQPGNEFLGTRIKDIPVSLFPQFMCQLYRDNKILIPDTQVITDENSNNYWGSLSFITDEKDKSLYIFLIEDLAGDFVGILGVEYIDKNYTLTDEDIKYIENRKGALGSLIDQFLNE